MNLRDARENLKAILARKGLRPALVFLNGLTGHRFTAVYRFPDGTPEATCLFDRLNPTVDSPAMSVAAAASFTVNESFVLAPLPVGDPTGKRRDLQSCCGVALRNEDGDVVGFLCHLDFRPVPISPGSIALLEEAASLLGSDVAADPSGGWAIPSR